uniref:Uncharacterized protein n=1 Tax=Craspedostauros australis TaxID=1486917 RepID=A0A6T6I1H2_9STRA|mmetsp:Transcript_8217/g.22302  ORF Transcript_8217/g.22302 Transcript_8217/m.22302 type:complete len:351 (+) Transcript_8217:255-1307(+)|eukprot:CAMPEP_0198108064 /NCGR_PEP_ID=MMETSP1442-20131203/155_1 /TAXON_ID= /ORGANISM="Craspedostauros australis, Strain CCMP3328" /LENGTH=350 /DNA_ID=CAMNT_0043763259 /DNA_START=266 /DNA_END=1318 /DNA_ORIENTATION=-
MAALVSKITAIGGGATRCPSGEEFSSSFVSLFHNAAVSIDMADLIENMRASSDMALWEQTVLQTIRDDGSDGNTKKQIVAERVEVTWRLSRDQDAGCDAALFGGADSFLVFERLLSVLANIKSLHRLECSNMPRCPEVFSALATVLPTFHDLKWFGMLKSVELKKTNGQDGSLFDQGCWERLFDAFTRCPQLATVDLDDNAIRWEVAEQLALRIPNVKELQHLILSNNPVSDTGVYYLCQHALNELDTKIRILALGQCEIGDCGIQELCLCLRNNNHRLQRIFLYSNTFQYSSPFREELTFWIDANCRGRAIMRRDDTPPSIFPHVLARAGRNHNLMHALLTELPHKWSK